MIPGPQTFTHHWHSQKEKKREKKGVLCEKDRVCSGQCECLAGLVLIPFGDDDGTTSDSSLQFPSMTSEGQAGHGSALKAQLSVELRVKCMQHHPGTASGTLNTTLPLTALPMDQSAFQSHPTMGTQPANPSLWRTPAPPQQREMQNITGLQLVCPGLSILQGILKSCVDDATCGQVHLLSEQSQDKTVGKCPGLPHKQPCIWIPTPCSPVAKGVLSEPGVTSIKRKMRMAKQKNYNWGKGLEPGEQLLGICHQAPFDASWH